MAGYTVFLFPIDSPSFCRLTILLLLDFPARFSCDCRRRRQDDDVFDFFPSDSTACLLAAIEASTAAPAVHDVLMMRVKMKLFSSPPPVRLLRPSITATSSHLVTDA